MLAAVAALVFPVVGGRVEHTEVGRGRMVEQLGDLVVGERVGVVGTRRMRVGALGGEAGELVGRLVGERIRGRSPRCARTRARAGIGATDVVGVVAAPVRANVTRPSALRGFVLAVAGDPHHHVDDR